MGPWIVTDLDPRGFRIIVRHNGQVWEDFSSADQIWDTATWIHELSNYATLYPGDVLWMGTQGADGDMFPGDTIEVEISGIGTLRTLRRGGGIGWPPLSILTQSDNPDPFT